jgi:hypothetical protein
MKYTAVPELCVRIIGRVDDGDDTQKKILVKARGSYACSSC